jgi:undecaprenyl diphosphate synthase
MGEVVTVVDESVQELKGEIPTHVAIIMDGNGRWAKLKGRPRIFGHKAGMESVRNVVKTAGELGVKILTLYAFSKENWSRPRSEVLALMSLLRKYTKLEKEELKKQGIKVQAIGRTMELFPKAREALEETIKYTASGKKMLLNLAISYSGRVEIIDAVREIARDAKHGLVQPDDIDEDKFARYLYTKDLPDPDLLIRTSGEMRISNFLLYQMAYTEIYVTDVLWPDFRRDDLFRAIAAYQRRERRFGQVIAD